MSLRRLFTILVFPLILCSQFGCFPGADQGPPPPDGPGLWEITAGKHKCYLFGSIHNGAESFYPLPPAIIEAYASSKSLVIEARPDIARDPVEVKMIEQFIAINGRYPERGELFHNVSKETGDMLRAYCQENKLPQAKFDRLKPWVASSTIDDLELKKIGLDVEKGTDMYFVKKALLDKKQIVELETPRDQLEMFARMNPEMQELILADTLRQTHDYKQRVERMIAAWKDGNLEAMRRVILIDPLAEEPRLKDFYVKLFDQRNAKMVAKIEKHLNSETVFIVVGAGHLVGEKGIIQLLQDRGFAVKQVVGVGKTQ
jgi:uncharacterized protein YbaP (TraB family)